MCQAHGGHVELNTVQMLIVRFFIGKNMLGEKKRGKKKGKDKWSCWDPWERLTSKADHPVSGKFGR